MAQAPKALSQPRGVAISERILRIAETVAVAATAAFAGGALLSQTVIVPSWRAMDPVASLGHFRTYGPATGATVFPFEVASVLPLSITTYSAVKGGRPGRLPWASPRPACSGRSSCFRSTSCPRTSPCWTQPSHPRRSTPN